MKRLLLFDIDGTLLRCGPQVGRIFVQSLVEVYGVAGETEGYSFSGKTDPQIVLELQQQAGLAEETILDLLPDMRRLYTAKLEAELDRDLMLVLPGVQSLLDSLVERGDLELALLTGNWQDCATIKLSRFGLEQYFGFGAFGEDGPERRKLVPVALERAAVHSGTRFAPEEALIVGDSVLDVDCAQASGVPALAVATGFTSHEHLEQSGADWVFADLEQARREFTLFSNLP